MSAGEGMVTCASCGEQNRVGARFCDACGARLEPAPAPGESRRTVTIVFVDVAGSTALGERLDPETLRDLMGRYFDVARTVVERHGGIVEKFIGDAVMAVFGLPTLHEDDALRAVRAADELQRRLGEGELASWITTRMGINTGEVVASDRADAQRLVTGDAVNTAARLEQHAPPGGILLGNDTWRLVRDAVTVEAVAPVAAKGKQEPLTAWRLVSIDPSGAVTSRRLDAPLVGRERELGRLLRSFEDVVAERRCGLFTLLGPAGVGKSRLVHELVQRVRGSATILRGRCLPYGEGITYWPVAEVMRAAAVIDEADGRETALTKLGTLVAGEPDADDNVRFIAAAIGIVDGDAPREEVYRAVRRTLEVLAAERPLVVVFDDLQWAESTFLDLVEHLVDWSRGAPILVVALARPDLLDKRPTWGGGKLDAQTVLLEGLGEGDTRTLIASLLGSTPEPDLLRRVEEVTEGNPLFVEQLIAMLVEDGHLVREGDSWRPARDLAAIHVPPTIAALLAARLDGLPADERQVAERASVVGRVFERVAVAELSPPEEREQVPTRLRSLVRRELIRPDPSSVVPDDTFRFRHILIRDAAYEALSKRDRAELHARFADWLEQTMQGRLAEFEEILGYHLDQAVRYREELGVLDATTSALRTRAADHLAAAGMRAGERSDSEPAIRLLSRAVALRQAGNDLRLDELFALAIAFADETRDAEALPVVELARDRASQLGDGAGVLRADVHRASMRAITDPSFTGARAARGRRGCHRAARATTGRPCPRGCLCRPGRGAPDAVTLAGCRGGLRARAHMRPGKRRHRVGRALDQLDRQHPGLGADPGRCRAGAPRRAPAERTESSRPDRSRHRHGRAPGLSRVDRRGVRAGRDRTTRARRHRPARAGLGLEPVGRRDRVRGRAMGSGGRRDDPRQRGTHEDRGDGDPLHRRGVPGPGARAIGS